ncbi:THAP domain-containing protein 5-like [Phyllopteryx taeniolatus]|uniref:THAP domain-containing protein 5-like n=1 Tax=Phyllopteryx taeniolatus TaxID=161469 RepID=UPI002AD29C64|nr:THAP domain-containing protein 5-like [Phyllopteryx taeniolatus]
MRTALSTLHEFHLVVNPPRRTEKGDPTTTIPSRPIMPKYCSVPNCKNDSTSGSDRKSFYKFPLHDPERLQVWLGNIGRDNWTPSRHQYICHEHFAPTCFKVRWGIRYLESDAVPTVFRRVEKRKVMDDNEKKAKVFRRKAVLVEEPSQWAVVGGSNTAANLPYLPTLHTVAPLTQPVDQHNEGKVVLLPDDRQEELLGAFLTPAHRLTVQELPAEDPCESQVVAYFESIPSVFPGHLLVSSDTMLSSALSPEPIPSTLPIVSKHAPPPSKPLALEADGGYDQQDDDDDDADSQDHQLEEHCYHKHSLSKEQLEVVVAELQKKVKVLQQRHRRHLDKLLGLENTVSQLRQKNMMTEERLQLLERAYIQSSASMSNTGETVAIIYEENDAAYFYTLSDGEEKL